jgi:hypothetical protein
MIPTPDGIESDGEGNIFVASSGVDGSIYEYNIMTNTVNSTNWPVPGLDDLAPAVYLGSRPTGYVEICKQSNPSYPVSGIFDFTATAPFFNSGTIEVPVGACSGAVQVPYGAVTITETPTIGDLVSSVTAYSYNILGQYVNELINWTEPDLYATVGVAQGDESLETLATFTNYAASPGQLKVCKIAGPGVPVGTLFTFTVTGLQPFQIEAGPADQGGFCEVVGMFPVNTPVMVTEHLSPTSPYKVSTITVACNACTYTIQIPSVVTTIGAGITEVAFTNISRGNPRP